MYITDVSLTRAAGGRNINNINITHINILIVIILLRRNVLPETAKKKSNR